MEIPNWHIASGISSFNAGDSSLCLDSIGALYT